MIPGNMKVIIRRKHDYHEEREKDSGCTASDMKISNSLLVKRSQVFGALQADRLK
nr:MAG TPA: hypothetical protein [Caudoviricetes sp.]